MIDTGPSSPHATDGGNKDNTAHHRAAILAVPLGLLTYAAGALKHGHGLVVGHSIAAARDLFKESSLLATAG